MTGIPGTPPNLHRPAGGLPVPPALHQMRRRRGEETPVLREVAPGHFVAIHAGMPVPEVRS